MGKGPRRAINPGPNSEVGKQRQVLYQKTMLRIKEAMLDGYMLEAVALLESAIADRLECRIAFIHENSPDKRFFGTVGRLFRYLKKKELEEPFEAIELYEAGVLWADERNKALHQFAKQAEDSKQTWEDKYEAAALTAETGHKLFRDLDKLIRKLNRTRPG